MKRALLLFVFLAAFASSLSAHEVRPAYLELRQTGPETYDALWKVPGQGENLRLGLYVELPTGSTNVTAPRATMANNAFTERWTVKRPGGLTGGTIHIAGLTATMTDVLVRLERLDGSAQVTRLTPATPSFTVEAAPNGLEVARTYTVLGIEHILTGIDHLLFVLALLIINVCVHMRIGMREVIDDYVSEGPRHRLALMANTIFAITVAALTLLSIAKIVFWG